MDLGALDNYCKQVIQTEWSVGFCTALNPISKDLFKGLK